MAQQASPDSNTQTDNGTVSPKNPKTNDPLLQSIKQFVNLTNSTLANFERATDESSTMIVSRLRQLGRQGWHIASRSLSTYEHRGQYGPQIVAGAAVVVGGAVALRTRRVPAALVGAGLGGAAAYGNVYGYEDYSATSWRNSIPKKE
eukprot:CAMPEP_0172568902 /NCGR_PEP_ID=MMETSP1067-20121228/121458_1 /TAXON_ID=265564 ORGANISM="Thalassiosira punctigera, Strain Tpunct2005C2" /NCGR_SAMPLE_ID=MMETSP1067 /ASSEMBLY_ACC=CAM_ASM_000444 /LENGTH=146 /DNA_ID=CAMNT_0013360615 /DNA_START=220 /DNA_END=660 /DNA_ORIENTATION=+